MQQFILSEWDTKHFGVSIAKLGPCAPEQLPAAFDAARRAGIEMLIARSSTGDMKMVHALEAQGAQLMDTLVRYHADLAKVTIPNIGGEATVRPFVADDIAAIGQVAGDAFKDYIGHFHNDPRLDRKKSSEVYVGWAVNSCQDKSLADEVFVADLGFVAGFITLKVQGGIGRVVLNAVSPRAQGTGIYRLLILACVKWCKERGLWAAEVGTHINTYAAQKVWIRTGFEIFDSLYTFHKWFT